MGVRSQPDALSPFCMFTRKAGARLPPGTGARLVLGRALGVGKDALEGLLLENESSPWAGHKRLTAVSPSCPPRVTGGKGDSNRPKGGLYPKQGKGRVKALPIALGEATSNPDLTDLVQAAIRNNFPWGEYRRLGGTSVVLDNSRGWPLSCLPSVFFLGFAAPKGMAQHLPWKYSCPHSNAYGR